MNSLHKLSLLSLGSVLLLATPRAQAQSMIYATGGSSWMKATGATSAANTNWSSTSPGDTISNPPGVDDIAVFGSEYTGTSNAVNSPFGPQLHGSYNITNLNGTGTSLGLAASSAGATDTNTEALGTIDLAGVSGTTDFYIGNNYGASGYNCFLETNGTTFNGVANTIISNSGSQILTIEGLYPTQTSSLGLLLGNTANVIQTSSTSSTVISANIYEVNASSSITTSGSGTLTLSGANQYSGGTNVNAGSLVVSGASSLGSGAVAVAGGALSTTLTANVGTTLSMGSGSIALTAGATPTLQLALNQNFLMTGGALTLSSGAGGPGSLAGNGGSFTISNGTLDLNNTITNYGQSYDLLSGFSSGSSSVNGLAITGYTDPGYTANLSDAGVLTFNPVAAPEPSTWVMIAGALSLIVICTRRHSTVRNA